jgi:hypothetical protein
VKEVSFFDPKLRHDAADDHALPAAVNKLYADLCELLI